MKSVSDIIWNLLSCGLPRDHNLEELRKLIMLNLISGMGCFVLSILGLIGLLQGNRVLFFADYGIAIILVIMLVCMRKRQSTKVIDYMGIVLIYVFFLFLIANGGVNRSAFVWGFVFPLISIFLLGKKRGLIASLAYIVSAIAVFFLGYKLPYISEYPFDLVLRFVMAYLTTVLFSYGMEHIRVLFQMQLTISNTELKNAEVKRVKLTEELLEQATSARSSANEAEAASLAKSQFLANMSHELRTPLNSIIGFSQILQAQIAENLSEKQKAFFENIKNSGHHLLEMVNDILDLSKIEAGKMEIANTSFDFGRMLERAPNIIKAEAYEKKIKIEVNVEPDLGWLNGDPTRLKQVIYNLLSNAVKFTDSGKRIGIEATVENDFFTVSVWDEGIGIQEALLETVFDPFEQLRASQSHGEEGTGLGLAISRQLIRLHQGTIVAACRVGGGSQFIIKLPGRLSAPETATDQGLKREQVLSENPATSARILVTEDSKINQQLIEAALDKYELVFADSGEEALQKISGMEFDLVLMDIQLPGMDGTETMKQIRQNTSRHIPILVVTAFAMKGDEEKYLNEGFDDYISKPVNIDSLLQKVADNLK